MRPRPDATENMIGVGLRHAADAASMRPRPDATENLPGSSHPAADVQAASMRPRPDATENEVPQLPAAGQAAGWLQ